MDAQVLSNGGAGLPRPRCQVHGTGVHEGPSVHCRGDTRSPPLGLASPIHRGQEGPAPGEVSSGHGEASLGEKV